MNYLDDGVHGKQAKQEQLKFLLKFLEKFHKFKYKQMQIINLIEKYVYFLYINFESKVKTQHCLRH